MAAHNVDIVGRLEHTCACTVARYVPYTAASDHLPIELEFVQRRRRNGRKGLKAPRRIPRWLYETHDFKDELHQSVIAWSASRARGLEGLVEFAEIVQLTANHCLDRIVFRAKSPNHKFDVVAAAVRAALKYYGGQVLSFAQAARYCKIVPDLEAAVEWDMDLDGDCTNRS